MGRVVRVCVVLFTLAINQCATVDFIPDPDYSPTFPTYSKKSWNEVEVYFIRPNKRISIQGEIRIRDFENSGKITHYINYIKRDMFQRKIDGVYIQNSKVQTIHDPIIQTKDTRGNVTHSYGGSESSIKVWTGYAYRDK